MPADKDEKQATNRRRWLAVLLATVMMVASYVLFLYALVVAAADETTFAGGLIGVALGLVPGVFAVAAFVSQHPNAIAATFAASAIWLVFTIPIGVGDLATGMVTGFGAGGIFAFRLGEHHTRRSRVLAVALAVVYTIVLRRFFPEVGLFAGAPLPFLAIALADVYRERFDSTV